MIDKDRVVMDDKIRINKVDINQRDIGTYMRNKLNMYAHFERESSIQGLLYENLIIPLDFLRVTDIPNDRPGCRIYSWQLFNTPQLKNAMKINGNFQRVEVPYVPITEFFSSLGDESCEFTKTSFEVYDKFLNITYLVNDEFMQEWSNPYYKVDSNIAKKQVSKCSVSELLFAIKNKLSK